MSLSTCWNFTSLRSRACVILVNPMSFSGVCAFSPPISLGAMNAIVCVVFVPHAFHIQIPLVSQEWRLQICGDAFSPSETLESSRNGSMHWSGLRVHLVNAVPSLS